LKSTLFTVLWTILPGWLDLQRAKAARSTGGSMLSIVTIRRSLRRGDRRGTAAIEFALLSPILLALLLGVVELGFGIYAAIQAQSAAEAGALYAAKHGWDSAGISAAVVNATGASSMAATPAPTLFCGCPSVTGVAAIACNSTCTGGSQPGEYVQINSALARLSILSDPGLGLATTLTGKSAIRIQ
jgi:Flp pilus assembly protein TadG